MKKKIVAIIIAIVLIITAGVVGFKVAENSFVLTKKGFDSAIATSESYKLGKSFSLKYHGITGSVTIDGRGKKLMSTNKGPDAMIFQNEYAQSSFSNVKIVGNEKQDVGIWIGNGEMTFTDSSISGFTITDGRYSAIGMAGSSKLTLNNTSIGNNKDMDIIAYDETTININEGTAVENIHLGSQFVKVNIGDNWNGEFDLTFDYPNNYPASKAIGTIGEKADISKINITNDGYYLENVEGKLFVMKENETALHFDMAKEETLYKGSTGFLYGESEINVPSVDLLQGLKPDTMVQKAVGGLQHPTGDAVRTSSALLSAGVRDMQIYLQDNYLEWPYDAPMKDDTVDLDEYQKTVETIVYKMICDEVKTADSSSFKGSDGKYYIVKEETAKKYSFVLFNEPDQIWFSWNLEGLEKAWKQIYEAVHKIYPQARCVGPNFSGFNAEAYDEFLAYCKDNNCLPEIISWHELGDISLVDFKNHYDTVAEYVEKYYDGNKPELMVNEYARHYDIGSPGGIVKWLAMFEDKDISACMAYWAMANSLNEMAADQNSPTSTWWVYHWYAQMTGSQCPITYPDFEKTRFYGLMSYDRQENIGYALFGGSEDENAPEIVCADNIVKTNLLNKNGAVNVKIYGVGFSGQQGANYKPQIIFDGTVQTENGTLKIQLDDVDEMEAYFAVLTKADDNAKAKTFEGAKLSTLSYEAENATLLGNAMAYSKIGWATFATSGRADIGSLNNNDSGVKFDVEVKKEGTYKASIFYSLQAPFVNPQTLEPQEDGQNRGIGKSLLYGVFVDGKELPNIVLESTVTWAYKNHCDIEIQLTKGKHTIEYRHINGDESEKGNLQLTAAFDKLDLTLVDSKKDNFEIDLTEMSAFKTKNGYKVTAVAPKAGYYRAFADASIKLTKQAIDYASDALTTSQCKTYDIPVGNTVYLSQGANTIGIIGKATKVRFVPVASKGQIISAKDMKLVGENPILKDNSFASSGKVVAEIGTGKENYVYFDVNVQAEGMYNFAIRYTNDEPAPVMLKSNGDTYVHPYNVDLVERYAQIVANDSQPETVYFRNTMSWDTFKTVDVQLKLKQGKNRIKIYNDNSYHFSQLVNSTAPEIDQITISNLSIN